jgi:hypothetical protein
MPVMVCCTPISQQSLAQFLSGTDSVTDYSSVEDFPRRAKVASDSDLYARVGVIQVDYIIVIDR